MSGFQPYDTDEGLYYPSGQAPVGPGLYAVDGLTEVQPDLYGFQVGDYAYPSLVPVPHVEATLFTFAPGTETITVYRTAKGRTMPVRGQIRVYAVGGRNVVDWEAPFGIPLTYRAEQFDTNGNSLGYTAAFSTQLDVTGTWIHNVFDPAHGLAVTMAGQAVPNLPRQTPADVYYATGSGLATAVLGQRQGLADVDVSFLTFTDADADLVEAMWGDPYSDGASLPPVLCIRTGAGVNMRLPQPFIALVAKPLPVLLDQGVGGELIRWECSATEVEPPAPALVATVLTYADLDAAFPDHYADRDAAFSSYLEQDKAYQYAGTANGDTA